MRKRTNLSSIARLARRGQLMFMKTIAQTAKYGFMNVPRKSVLFVAGVQRSGTNMVMGALERSFDTDVYHERDPRAFRDFEMLSREKLRELIRRSRAPHIVIKTLCELQELKGLLNDFDNAKALWIVRNYSDVVNSHTERWTSMPWSIREIVKDRDGKAGWRGRGMSNETYEFVRDVYHPEISNTSACALFWYMRNKLFFEQSFDFDPRISLFSYERLVAHSSHEFQKLFEFSGISYSPRTTKLIIPSVARSKAAPEIDKKIQEACDCLENQFKAIVNH